MNLVFMTQISFFPGNSDTKLIHIQNIRCFSIALPFSPVLCLKISLTYKYLKVTLRTPTQHQEKQCYFKCERRYLLTSNCIVFKVTMDLKHTSLSYVLIHILFLSQFHINLFSLKKILYFCTHFDQLGEAETFGLLKGLESYSSEPSYFSWHILRTCCCYFLNIRMVYRFSSFPGLVMSIPRILINGHTGSGILGFEVHTPRNWQGWEILLQILSSAEIQYHCLSDRVSKSRYTQYVRRIPQTGMATEH